MALNFPATPTDGETWVDPNSVIWTATVVTVDTQTVVSWTAESPASDEAFAYRGFADLTQPIPDNDVGAGTIYSVQNDVLAANINAEWGGLNTDLVANSLIICNQERPGQTPEFMWSPVATPASPWIRNNGVITPVNQGDDLNMKFAGVNGGDIQLQNYTTLP
jgi:hypothetical protein